MRKTIIHNIIHPVAQTPTVLQVTYDEPERGVPAQPVQLELLSRYPVTVSPQQLTELATLFLALAGT